MKFFTCVRSKNITSGIFTPDIKKTKVWPILKETYGNGKADITIGSERRTE